MTPPAMPSPPSHLLKQKSKRKRHQTQVGREEQVRKCQETKKAKKLQREAARIENEKRMTIANQTNFFVPRKTKQSNKEEQGCNIIVDKRNICHDERIGDGQHSVDEIDNVVVVNHQILTDKCPSDVSPNLDYDSDDDGNEKNDSDNIPGEEVEGVQQVYVRAIQQRMQLELSSASMSTSKLWLLEYLNNNDWWVRTVHARNIVKNLGLKLEHQPYYRDVYVWLPDVRWTNLTGISHMPCCPNCKTNKRVGAHGFRDNHFGRVVVNLTDTYYIVSRRYICHACQEVAVQAKKQVEELATEYHLVVEEAHDAHRQYTFMGWDKRILPFFPSRRGELNFPAVLTWKAGLDKLLVDMMRPLLDGGLRPDRLSRIILELHSKKYSNFCIEHELRNATKRQTINFNASSISMLSDFGDKLRYRGLVPTGKFLAHVYKIYHSSIGSYLDMEVKKRGAEFLHWDVSYKEAKHLCRYRGKSVFKGLVTGMNEVGEVRMQFHVYSDSHEQMTAALEAFQGTTRSLGLPPVRLFYTDNPAGDKQYFMRMLPSLRAQQDEFDALLSQSETGNTVSVDVGSDKSLPLYPFANISSVRVASTEPEIKHLIMALKEGMTCDKIGLDAEWNVTKNSIGMQTGVSKVLLIQIAYRDLEGKIAVLILQVGRLKQLPSCLDSLLGNTSKLDILGANVSADLTKIAKDFNSVHMKTVDQKSRDNVHNLGLLARKRDVIQDGSASLQRIVECTLMYSLDKNLQCSDWSGVLTEDQIQYAAIDAAVSLEAGEKLLAMPDLTRRLSPEEFTPHRKVDLIPQHGSAACMATRAATATIYKSVQCACPPGMIYVYRKKEHKMVKAGKGSCVVVLNNVYSPALIIPNYKWENKNRKDAVTLANFVEDQTILLPISMIKAHVASANVRPTPIIQCDNNVGRSQPASNYNSINNVPKRKKVSNQNDSGVVELFDDDSLSVCSSDEAPDSDANEEYYDDENNESVGNKSGQLNTNDIAYLQKALFAGESARSGRNVLLSPHLSQPPNPIEMRDKFSAVMGDVFHAMDRTKTPHHHEAKKSYFVALREAFFVWNQSKLKELEEHMVEAGYTLEEVHRRKYFNSNLFRGCVDRHLPAPTILYWRVRAVYVMFGSMKDSKTQAPLFNDRAWKKADNVLKEILEGYYSDPPGFAMYNKRLRSDGTVMKNVFGMEMIECKRGTNRTEGYHKNIITSFGTWHVGIEMSDCLLRERRHRHNMMVSMRRRLGFPRIGHYDIWLVEIYQALVMKNHGLRIYPELGNTSDYGTTNESFDTIPLHSKSLAKAVQRRYDELDTSQLSLTTDQRYLCRAMGTPLPFLPFSGAIEKKAFAAFVLQKQDVTSIDDEAAAIQWCEFIDGKEIKPKLPSHMRTHIANWEKNQRVRECETREASNTTALMELNQMIAPVFEYDSCNAVQNNSDTAIGIDGNNNACCDLQTSVRTTHIPPKQLWQLRPIIPAGMFFPMPPQAISHILQNMIVGGICVSAPQVGNPVCVSKGGRPKNSNDTGKRRKRSCRRCRDNAERGGDKVMYICKGKGGDGRAACQYFDENSNKIREIPEAPIPEAPL